MSESMRIVRGTGNPYKIVDHVKQRRKGVIASSLQELTDVARSKLGLPSDAQLTIVLEQDGTEVDDEEYFATIEKNTNLMVLQGNQKWKATGNGKTSSRYLTVDEVDTMERSSNEGGNVLERDRPPIEPLIFLLYKDPTLISLVGDYGLELLSDMDPDSLTNIVPDRLFLEQLKEASGGRLANKRDARESMAFFQIYANACEQR